MQVILARGAGQIYTCCATAVRLHHEMLVVHRSDYRKRCGEFLLGAGQHGALAQRLSR